MPVIVFWKTCVFTIAKYQRISPTLGLVYNEIHFYISNSMRHEIDCNRSPARGSPESLDLNKKMLLTNNLGIRLPALQTLTSHTTAR